MEYYRLLLTVLLPLILPSQLSAQNLDSAYNMQDSLVALDLNRTSIIVATNQNCLKCFEDALIVANDVAPKKAVALLIYGPDNSYDAMGLYRNIKTVIPISGFYYSKSPVIFGQTKSQLSGISPQLICLIDNKVRYFDYRKFSK